MQALPIHRRLQGLRHPGGPLLAAAVLASACAPTGSQVRSSVPAPPAAQAGSGHVGARPGMVAEQRPVPPLSRWHDANWNARAAAFAAAGLTAVQLTPISASQEYRVDLPSGTWCRLVEVVVHGEKQRAFFNPSGDFGVTPAGRLHCVKIDSPSLGEKSVLLPGRTPNCSTGNVTAAAEPSYLYAIPPGVEAGELLPLSVPAYNIAVRYAQSCPQVP